MKVGDTTSTSFVDKSAVNGTIYLYTVKCIDSSKAIVTSAYDTNGISTTITAPSVNVANSAGGIKISWNKVLCANGYYVYRKEGSTGKWEKLATVDKETLTYLDSTGTNGNTYYYTVKPKSTVSNGTYISSAAIKCSK